jgi:hypothetical protein
MYLKISLPIGCGYPKLATTSIHGVPPLFEPHDINSGLYWSEPLCIVKVLVSFCYPSQSSTGPFLFESSPGWILRGSPFLPTRPSLFLSLASWAVLFSSAPQIPVPFLFLLLGLIQCTVFCCNTILCTLFHSSFSNLIYFSTFK